MIYACIGFIGVVIGALCVYLCTPVIELGANEGECVHYDETEEDARLARQWQNLLNYTADAGGEDDDADS